MNSSSAWNSHDHLWTCEVSSRKSRTLAWLALHLFKCVRALFEDSEDLIIVVLIGDADQRNYSQFDAEYFVSGPWFPDLWGDFWCMLANTLLGKCDSLFLTTHTYAYVCTFVSAGPLWGLLWSQWKWGAQLCPSRGPQLHTMTLVCLWRNDSRCQPVWFYILCI